MAVYYYLMPSSALLVAILFLIVHLLCGFYLRFALNALLIGCATSLEPLHNLSGNGVKFGRYRRLRHGDDDWLSGVSASGGGKVKWNHTQQRHVVQQGSCFCADGEDIHALTAVGTEKTRHVLHQP